jgi:hypothetical protein
MKAIINNIIDSYRMEAEAWSILLDSTQRALEQAENKGKADEHEEMQESRVAVCDRGSHGASQRV